MFRATPTSEVLVLWNKFEHQTSPQAGVIQGSDAALYGVTLGNPVVNPSTKGAVFKMSF